MLPINEFIENTNLYQGNNRDSYIRSYYKKLELLEYKDFASAKKIDELIVDKDLKKTFETFLDTQAKRIAETRVKIYSLSTDYLTAKVDELKSLMNYIKDTTARDEVEKEVNRVYEVHQIHYLLYNINDDLSNSYITKNDYEYLISTIISNNVNTKKPVSVDIEIIKRQDDIFKLVDGITRNKQLSEDVRKTLLLDVQNRFLEKIYAGTSLISAHTLGIASKFVVSLKQLTNTVDVQSEENSKLFKISLRLEDPYKAAAYAAYSLKTVSYTPEHITNCVTDTKILQRFDIASLKSSDKDKAKKKIERFAQNIQTILKPLGHKEPHRGFIVFIKQCEEDLGLDLSEFLKDVDAIYIFNALMEGKNFNSAFTYGFEKTPDSVVKSLEHYLEIYKNSTFLFDQLNETNLNGCFEIILKFHKEELRDQSLELLTFFCSRNILSNTNLDQAYQLLGRILELAIPSCLNELVEKFLKNTNDSNELAITFDHLNHIASHIKNQEKKKEFESRILDAFLYYFYTKQNQEGIRFILKKSPSHFEKLIEIIAKEDAYCDSISSYSQYIEDPDTRKKLEMATAKIFVSNATGYQGYVNAVSFLKSISDSEILISLINQLVDKIQQNKSITNSQRTGLADCLASLLKSKNI